MTHSNSQASHQLVTTKTLHNGQILLVTLNQPSSRNAISKTMALQLHHIFTQFQQSDALKVAVLTGSGHHFCAGADLKLVDHPQDRNELNEDASQKAPLGVTRLFLRKPVIAAIEGYCVAGGLELACWCDLRVGAKESIYGVYCRRFSVPLIDMGTIRLPRLIGYSRAMDMVLTGRTVTAQEAFQFGLLNRLVPSGQTLEKALQIAEDLCALPQTCMRNDRESMYRSFFGSSDSVSHQISQEMRFGKASIASEEFSAAVDRFVSGQGRHGQKVLGKKQAVHMPTKL